MKSRFTFFPFTFLLLLIVIPGKGQPPVGYYNSAAGLTGQALQQALHGIIANHTVLQYSNLWSAFASTDKKTNGKVWDIYSDVPGGTPPYEFTFFTDQCGSYNSEGDCYNKEHSFPASWFGDSYPMYSDLFHIYPTDGWVNNKRSNYPYGKVSNPTWTSLNGSKLGDNSTSGYASTAFEPIDAYKGDLARSYFYMATRYLGEDSGWPGSAMVTGSQLKPWAKTLLYQWHLQDPVSQKETDRNNAVYALQKNRNPYIDHPEYADAIFGPTAGTEEYAVVTIKGYPNPAVSTCTFLLPQPAKHTPEVIVYTLAGKETDAACKKTTSEITLSLSDLPAGIYLVKIYSPDDQINYFAKIVKL